ncbi:MAG TPA: pseudouridine synthase [Xanthomonadales bacterium]|nr:pseudouridine synthase [Xanthomonadales bacterium]
MNDTKASDQPPTPQKKSERLQKIMATSGVGSRRANEKRISEGTVSLNGKIAEPGATAGPGDKIRLGDEEWRVVAKPVRFRTLIYNKPEGEITTRSDPDGRPTVFDRLPKLQNQRWVAVGRLDINTSGLLILTTDGELANAMMHPSGNVDREYACRIHGEVKPEHLENMKKGVKLEDGMASFSDIQPAGGEGVNRWFHVVIMEGRNREVRRLWQSQGLEVSRLKRVRYGAAFLPKHMHMGKWHEISQEDHQVLREDVKLPSASTVLALDRENTKPTSRPVRKAQKRVGHKGRPQKRHRRK